MSLLNDAMSKCVFLDKRITSDGEGGYTTEWVTGAEFDAAITFDSSINARIGEKSGVTSLYTVTAAKNIPLEYHTVFRRLSDNKTFRVTSDGDDKQTPPRASFSVLQVTAEEWTI